MHDDTCRFCASNFDGVSVFYRVSFLRSLLNLIINPLTKGSLYDIIAWWYLTSLVYCASGNYGLTILYRYDDGQ